MNLVRTWPQGQAGPTPLGWTWPQPLMPPRIDGWPRGVVPSGNAEALLATAVGYWDASKYRPGDRFLRNQGVAGELLDLRLGSSVVANTNDPLYLAPEQSGYVYLPGQAGSYLSVPDESALRLSTQVDIQARAALDTWTPSGITTFVAKNNDTSSDAGYVFAINTNGTLVLYLANSASTVLSATSSVAVSAVAGSVLWVRATWRSSDGRVQFLTSTDGSTWTQLGADRTISLASINASTTPLLVGANRTGSVNWMAGLIYRAIVKDGIDGTTVLDIDCDAITSGSATSFTATTGQTVTINRSTSGRKSVAMPSRWNGGRPCFLLGTDDYLECVNNWQHQLLNFGQGDSFTVLAVVRRWDTQASHAYVSKKATATASDTGWLLLATTTNRGRIYVADGTNQPITTATMTSGPLSVVAGVRSVTSGNLTSYVNSAAGNTVTDTTTGTLANSLPMRIGNYAGSGSTAYADMEFRAAAVWRRPLSAAEITTLSTYWGS